MIVKAKKIGKLTLNEAKAYTAKKSLFTCTACWLVVTNRSTGEVITHYYPCELPF